MTLFATARKAACMAAVVAVVLTPARAEDFNAILLDQIRSMPAGGGYSVKREAHDALKRAVVIDSDTVRIRADSATPSYCSGATYLVFLKTLGELQKRGRIALNADVWSALAPRGAPDGHGVWGRWNANGPGTARLFHELGMGRNFTSYAEARPGDFLKIFWRDAVGKNERGHLVVFLGEETVDGVEKVRFWSSNTPSGYGEKSVRKAEIARALFSRLEHPERIAAVTTLPEKDSYLASLLTTESSFAEAVKLSGAQAR
jgi:hypothetical protein